MNRIFPEDLKPIVSTDYDIRNIGDYIRYMCEKVGVAFAGIKSEIEALKNEVFGKKVTQQVYSGKSVVANTDTYVMSSILEKGTWLVISNVRFSASNNQRMQKVCLHNGTEPKMAVSGSSDCAGGNFSSGNAEISVSRIITCDERTTVSTSVNSTVACTCNVYHRVVKL